VKKILKIVSITLLIVVAGLTITIYSLSDKLEKVLLKEINEQLAVEGSFKKLDVTFWTTFPNVSLRMEHLTLKESTTLIDNYLLEADAFYLQFNLVEAIFGKYELEKVSADNLILRLAVKGDKENFVLLKSNSTDSINDKRIKIDLKAIQLHDAQIEYHDLSDTTVIVYDFERIKSKGKVETDKVDFKLDAKGACKKFVISGDTLPVDKVTALNAQLTYEIEQETLFIKKGSLDIDKTLFGVEGSFVFADIDSMDLRINSKASKISKIAVLMPQSVGDVFIKMKSEGDFNVSAQIAGKFGGVNIPTIEAQIKIKEAKLYPVNGQKPMENINLNANLTFSKSTEYVQIPVFSFKLGEHNFGGNIDLKGFSDPYIAGNLKGKIDLGYLNDLFDFEGVQMSGQLDCNINLIGKISEISSMKQFQDKGVIGQMQWSNISFSSQHEMFKNWEIQNCNAGWKLKGNQLSANNITGQLNNADFKLNISLDGLLPFIFNDKKMELYADLVTDRIELPLEMLGEHNSDFNEDVDTATDLFTMFPQHLTLDLNFEVADFKAKNISITDFKGALFANENQIKFSNISGGLVEGSFTGSVLIKKHDEQSVFSNVDIEGKALNIHKLFEMFDNFGQEEITASNFEGKLDLNTQMVLIIGRDGSFSKENLYAFSDLTIKDGILKNYEPMKSLSDYAEVSELENIRFGVLSNTIEIKDGEINFPFMDLGNSILNIKIMGKHNFDNYMDYTFRVRLSDALAAKYHWRTKKNKEDFEDLGNKGVALYIRMTGYPDDLKFKVEKIGVKPILTQESVKSEVKNAREEFKQTLKQEFSLEKREERKKQEAENEKVDWDE